ncbi:MAG TPA: hypothetical protein PLK44_14800 [Aestuariivirga sp.]|mgnify:FL=1|nr:hypothetical protein [Aestuariivirga sp.]HRA93560.1 hypothetical protein [Aestuariivirga sp.]
MASRISRISRSAKTGEFTVGAKASAKISKVEGMTLSKDMRTTFKDFDRKDMSADARRAILIDKYGKKGS